MCSIGGYRFPCPHSLESGPTTGARAVAPSQYLLVGPKTIIGRVGGGGVKLNYSRQLVPLQLLHNVCGIQIVSLLVLHNNRSDPSGEVPKDLEQRQILRSSAAEPVT